MQPFPAALPPNLQCGFCKRPVQGFFFRTLDRFACGNCAGQVDGVLKRNVFAAGPFFKAAVLGLLTALGCGVAWAVSVEVTHAEFGIVASLIGWAVAKVIFSVSGKRRGLPWQGLAVSLTALGFVVGKLCYLGFYVHDQDALQGEYTPPWRIAFIILVALVRGPSEIAKVFAPLDALWAGIAVVAAWRILKASPISVAGPFAYQPASGVGGIQFHTAEPLQPPGAV